MKSRLRQHRILMPTFFSKGTEVSRLINSISEVRGSLNNYLEIGLEYGLTFEAVRAKRKIAVDPNFRFHKGFQNFRSRFFELASDDFFSIRNSEVIDIAFLDGLHHASQTFRDFVNLLPLVNDKSIIIIDDTVPSDFHSTLSSPEATYLSRKVSGVPNDFKWHGDVYKCVYSLIENLPQLNWATIMDLGNPVTIFYGFNSILIQNKTLIFNNKKTYDGLFSGPKIVVPKEFNPMSLFEFIQNLEVYHQNL